MKTQENVKNDNIKLQAESLTDLPLTDEQADETRGGAGGLHVKVFDGSSLASDRQAGDVIVGAGPGAGPHVR